MYFDVFSALRVLERKPGWRFTARLSWSGPRWCPGFGYQQVFLIKPAGIQNADIIRRMLNQLEHSPLTRRGATDSKLLRVIFIDWVFIIISTNSALQ